MEYIKKFNNSRQSRNYFNHVIKGDGQLYIFSLFYFIWLHILLYDYINYT